ncbi:MULTISPECIES: hypothetical protein [Methanobacterium]|jgi:hypothetical protein|uniref:Uncharacterized protein n=1 Tax=Methanobacterium veterum TaxID=408577 RepID=A0A9E4ZW76_9EURY|nr:MULTISPECIES: hypothetical protein [Methanobacterium]MCZ3364404.1 hypothetical protein [Methanobacterium veterum]MCZ3372155.1 hypothetical protein [Methanobacterium veterum]
MAKAIRATPTITGKYADKFVERLNEPPSEGKKKFLRRAREVHSIIESNK